jgi:hypothetical protein
MIKRMRIGVIVVVAAALIAMMAGCGGSSGGKVSTSTSATVAAVAPDYASPSNWLALPQTITKQVDVFYLSDTTYSKTTPSSSDIGPIDDPKMQQGAKAKFTTTAAAFETVGNIYAPYNRQVDSQYKSGLPIPQQLSLEAGIPTSDAVSAFDYYIKNMNDGRPFILAGHSQGSNLIANILSGYMKEHPEVYKRMIAAYVIGFSITGDYLAQNPQLKFATGPDDTGVIISYNTEAPVMKATNPVTMPGGIAINPTTWTTSETPASVEQSLGGIEVDPQTDEAVVDASGNPVKVPHYADAQVNKQRGVVICSTADSNQLAPGNSAVAAGIYHAYDYALYFFDIRANAENRVAHYLNKE